MYDRIVSVGWSTHAVERLKERLNAEPGDVDDLLVGRYPFRLHSDARGGFGVDVQFVARFVLSRDPNPKRVGCWVVVTVLDWDGRNGRHRGKRAQAGRKDTDRMRYDLTDEDLQWIEQL